MIKLGSRYKVIIVLCSFLCVHVNTFELFHDKDALKRIPGKIPGQTLLLDVVKDEKHDFEKTESLL